MKSRIRAEVATEFRDLERLASEWNRLWNQSRRREIFTTFAWARACWRAYGGQRSLCAPLLYEGDELVGILPIVAEGRTLRFLGMPGADYNDLVCAEQTSAALLEAALSALASLPISWSECILENVSEHSEIVQQFRRLSGHSRSRLQLSSRTPCPTVVLGENREVLAAILGKKSLRQHENRLRRRGKLSFRHLEDREEIRRQLPRFFEQHLARRALAGDESLFSEEDSRKFYQALVEELEPGRELRFSVLQIDTQPIAYHLGFESNGKFLWYKPAFDVDYWDDSPGEVLIRKLFEYVAARDIQEFDFTGGAEPFKARFANRVNHNYTLNFYASGPRGRALQLYHRTREWIKGNPRTFGAVKSAVTSLERVFARLRDGMNRHGSLGLTRKALLRAFETALYARNEALIFAREKEPGPGVDEASEPADGQILLQPGTLGDLVSLSVEHSGCLNAATLHKMRARLKRGDLVYLVRKKERLVQIAWIGAREGIMIVSELGPEFRMTLEEPVSWIYDFWSPPTVCGEDVLPSVLKEMVRRTATPPRQVWIGCQGEDLESRRAIEEAGFQLRHRIRQLCLFHWFRRAWLR